MPNVIIADNVKLPAAEHFGKHLKKRRLSLGLTQTHIAERTGSTAAYISQVERAHANPTLDFMAKVAESLQLEVWNMLRPLDADIADTP